MSDEEESHCRLCAETTPISELISPDEDVGLNSKIAMKMSWINIDVTTVNSLPNSICYSCYDALQRTWLFLHAVRTAQTKLRTIYIKNDTPENSTSDIKVDPEDSGKPVNEDWEEFEVPKPEIKPEIPRSSLDVVPIDANALLDLHGIKAELDTDGSLNNSDVFNSTDSDEPLFIAAKKKITKKKKVSHHSVDDPDFILGDEPDEKITWDDYMCRCADCDAQCKNIMSLRLHSLQIHSRCCMFKCSDCGKVIISYKTFINHVRRLHKRSLRYCCEFCNKCYRKTSQLKHHRNKIHNDYTTTCQACGSSFDNIELLQDHLILYTKNCRKKVKKESLDLTEDLKCEHCHKEFKSRSNLQQHKLVHTERSRDFSCHVCGKMFFTKGTLSTHMITHEETKPFKCEFCPMTFRARGNLQSHISLHSGAKPFVCEQCGKSFRAKRHLKSHSIVHTDLMPYICNYCNKTFRFKTRLNLHLRQHTGAKPYNCVYCQRDFTNGSNFKKHMRRKHNIDTSRRKYNITAQFNNVEENSLESNNIERNQS